MKIKHLLISAAFAFSSSTLYAAETSSQSTTGSGSQSGISSQKGATTGSTTGTTQGQTQSQQPMGQGQQLPAEMSASRFQALDRDSDGYISRQEAGADQQLTVIFVDVDENRDDQLSSEEFSNYSGTEESAN